MRMTVALIFAALSLGLVAPVHSDASKNSVVIDFENLQPGGFVAGPGKNSTATASVSTEAAHTGKRSGKIEYAFANAGYIEFWLADAVPVSQTTEPFRIAFWVKGAGTNTFGNVALRFLDANGHVLQYRAPGLSDLFNSSGWARFETVITPTKFDDTWGGLDDKTVKPPIRFYGFGADHFDNTKSSGTIFVDDISVAPASQVSAAPSLSITSDKTPQVVRQGENITFNAQLTGATASEVAPLHYRWRMVDFYGKVVQQTTAVCWGGGAPPQPFKVSSAQPGFFLVTCERVDQTGGRLGEAHTTLAVLTPPCAFKPASGAPLIGVNTHLVRWSPAQAQTQVDLIRLAGFDIVRDGAEWGAVQPSAGVWHWEAMDRIVDALKRSRIDLLYCLGYSAQWASTGNEKSTDWHAWHNAPPVTERYVDFAKAAVNRYKPFVHDWEIWNEPDWTFWLGNADQYAALLSASVAAIHDVQPSATVMNGGISQANAKPHFTQEVMSRTSPKPDVWAYHSHGELENVAPCRSKIVAGLSEAGVRGIPVWLNEAGIASIGGISLREQAIILAKKIATSEALGDRAYVLYDLADDGINPTDGEDHYGIVFHDLTPKPAFAAVATVINLISGKSFVAQLPADRGQTAYQYRSAEETTDVFWTNTAGKKSWLFVRSDAPSAVLTDLMGRNTLVKPSAGCFKVPISDEPRFLGISHSRTLLRSTSSSATILALCR